MDAAFFVSWVHEAARQIEAHAAKLGELDRAIGDGDHGSNLVRGFSAAVGALEQQPHETPDSVLGTLGKSLVSKTGGASGPLYGTAFRRAGRTLGDAPEVDTGAVGAALRAALEGVRQLGSAEAGDKTMIDALAPAVDAYEQAVARGAGVAEAARDAAEAAEKGAEATVPMRARKGRASYLGDRSIGHQDPGATSTALILRALADVAAGETP